MLEQNQLNSSPAKVNDSEKRAIFNGLKPKTAFIAGLVSGILLICTVGFFVLLGIILSQDKGSSVSQVNNLANLNLTNNQQPTSFGQPAAVSKDDHLQGNEKAKVVMIEYSDFQCLFCQRHQETMKKIMTEFSGQVAWVYRHFPLNQLHPFANKAALSAECAGEQGKFWEYADQLFANQSKFSDSYFTQLASELNLKTDQFNSCLTSAKYQAKIDNQAKDGAQAGVTGTPGTFINNQLIKGAVPYEQFKAIVENALK